MQIAHHVAINHGPVQFNAAMSRRVMGLRCSSRMIFDGSVAWYHETALMREHYQPSACQAAACS